MARSFVGRLSELATLRGTIDRARHSDGPTVALVLGPAGSGKTRLLAETVAFAGGRRGCPSRGHESADRLSDAEPWPYHGPSDRPISQRWGGLTATMRSYGRVGVPTE